MIVFRENSSEIAKEIEEIKGEKVRKDRSLWGGRPINGETGVKLTVKKFIP